MIPILLLSLACSESDPGVAVPAPTRADPEALRPLLRETLQTPITRLDRLLARVDDGCAVVVDPVDPAGCHPDSTCIAMAFSATDGVWALEALATVGTLPASHRCTDAGPLSPLPGGPTSD